MAKEVYIKCDCGRFLSVSPGETSTFKCAACGKPYTITFGKEAVKEEEVKEMEDN